MDLGPLRKMKAKARALGARPRAAHAILISISIPFNNEAGGVEQLMWEVLANNNCGETSKYGRWWLAIVGC